MGMWIGRNRKARVTYGFDEIALVPGDRTINPLEVDTSFEIPRKNGEPIQLKIPILASAMDGVTDVPFCVAMGKLGGMGVINLEGIQTRYPNPGEALKKILTASKEDVTTIIQQIYTEPVKEELIARRVQEIKQSGVLAAVSSIPQKAERFAAIAQEAGADLFVVQSTVSTVRHTSTQYKSLDLEKFCNDLKIPVIIGNAVTYKVTIELMRCGVAGVLIGVGPGAACTSRGVLGLGVPQVTATVDCSAARDYYHKETGRYVPIITDGGMSKGGDVCKALACGADAVMVGSAFAKAHEAPGHGYHWGMATPHANL
ncbi:MAG TPA: GuaB3 family IMP dehydrogenase-related protein, partial [Verrucomicrobiae bacterium]|nr:GuaB3 family IMP dehydrogenase-related protein [Verrucomicrobiae bacterium]